MRKTPPMESRFIQLPCSFDPVRLQADLARCVALQWPLHYNQWDYAGSWTCIALRSATGAANDVYAHPGASTWANTPLLGQCDYFREVLSFFQCPLETVRLLALAPGSSIHTHRDQHTDYAHGFLRLHVPVITHPEVYFVVDGVALPMQAGECWYANFDLPHSVKNNSPVSRVHLVIDALRNEWTDQLLAQAGFPVAAVTAERPYTTGEKTQIIANLLAMNTEASRALAMQLQQSTDPLN